MIWWSLDLKRPRMNDLRRALFALLVTAGLSAAGMPAHAAELAGPMWHPLTLSGVRPVPRQEISFERNAVYGNDGCNRFSGDYRRTGRNGLRFGQMRSMLMACISPRAERASRAFSHVMEQTRGWQVRGSRLYLMDRRGREIAVFRR
jgi:heat shock protein HslJ